MILKRRYIIWEGLAVLGFFVLLLIYSIPRFLNAQNINTPENFPDLLFRSVIEEYMGVESGGKFTRYEAKHKTDAIHLGDNRKIASVKGIGFFPSIKGFTSRGSLIREIDISQNCELEIFVLTASQIKSIDISNSSKLKSLAITSCDIKELDFSNCRGVEILYCGYNKLKQVNLSHLPKLHILYCQDNGLMEIDVSHNRELSILDLSYNLLTNLNLSNNDKLTRLNVRSNFLTEAPEIPIIRYLSAVDFRYNRIQNQSAPILKALRSALPSITNLGENDLINNGMAFSPQRPHISTDNAASLE